MKIDDFEHEINLLINENKLLNSILEEQGYIKTENFRFFGICDLSKIPKSI